MLKRIVIASVLKPVDDIRAYKKMAQSIAKTNKYQVNIIGNESKNKSKDERIIFHSHKIISSSTVKRLILRERIFFKILRLKPDLLIVSTHELLNVALLIKLIIRCKVVYDVQENYSANIRYLNSTLLKRIYYPIIQFKELISRLYISQYWLAEQCYSSELSFVKNDFLVIENKAKKESNKRSKTKEIKVLFSGTISNYGGVKNALRLLTKIQEKSASASLKIIGQIHDSKLKNELLAYQKKTNNVELVISEKPVSHNEIVKAIFDSNLGIIGYQENQVNRNKIPTKLYEYSRYQLPYIVTKDTTWEKVSMEFGGSIPIDFDSIDIDKIINLVNNSALLFPNSYPEVATWEYESEKLINSINYLFDSI